MRRAGRRSVFKRFRSFLRSPRTILLEGAGVTFAGVVSTAVPQRPTPTERVRWAVEHGLLEPAARALGLHAVFTAWWFLAVVALAAASLALVLVEQWRKLLREGRRSPTEASLRTAPLRVEFERPARGAAGRVRSRHRLGRAGSPLFHTGLLIVMLAGVGRLLFGAEAMVQLYEGERLEPRPAAFDAQWGGPLARPAALGAPVVVRELLPERYPSGALRTLRARLVVERAVPREEAIAVNAPLDLGRERLYLSSTHGCAAFVEVERQGSVERRILMLDEAADREFVRSEFYPDGLELRLRAMGGARGERPAALEVRALRDGALVALGSLRPGEALALSGGGRIALADLRWWARFSASRDLSAWPAFAGFFLALLGAVLMFTLVPVDEAVIVRVEGDRERVVVALRPLRFAPLFRERLERLVRDEGGSGLQGPGPG
jgi:ResB-like family protein